MHVGHQTAVGVLIDGVPIQIAVLGVAHLRPRPVRRRDAVTGAGHPEPPHFVAATAVREDRRLRPELMEAAVDDVEAGRAHDSVLLLEQVDHVDLAQHAHAQLAGSLPQGQHQVDVDERQRVVGSPERGDGHQVSGGSPRHRGAPSGQFFDRPVRGVHVFRQEVLVVQVGAGGADLEVDERAGVVARREKRQDAADLRSLAGPADRLLLDDQNLQARVLLFGLDRRRESADAAADDQHVGRRHGAQNDDLRGAGIAGTTSMICFGQANSHARHHTQSSG